MAGFRRSSINVKYPRPCLTAKKVSHPTLLTIITPLRTYLPMSSVTWFCRGRETLHQALGAVITTFSSATALEALGFTCWGGGGGGSYIGWTYFPTIIPSSRFRRGLNFGCRYAPPLPPSSLRWLWCCWYSGLIPMQKGGILF